MQHESEISPREYSVKQVRIGNGIAFDFSNAPCFMCKPKTLGECGHPFEFIDEDWSREQSEKAMREAGRQLRVRFEKAVLEKTFGRTSFSG